MKLHILHCGEVCVDKALPFATEASHFLSYTGLFRSASNLIWLPVSAYLLEHKEGLILFDSGWHRDISPNGVYDKKAQIKHLGFIHYMLNKGKLAEGKAIDEQLKTLGIKPSDIKYVLLSHMHSDHASGLKHLKDAQQILCSKEEWSDTLKYSYRYVPSMWEGVNVETFAFEQSAIGPVGKSYDVFGDGSVVLVNIPGHTNGMFAAILKGESGFVLLFFDGGYAKKSYLEMIAPGTALNKSQAMKSLQWIADMANNPSCLQALATHDKDISPSIIEIA